MAVGAPNMDQFELYFKRADLDHDDRISGAEAVSFFKASGLPTPILAQGSIKSGVILKFELLYAPVLENSSNMQDSLNVSPAAVHEFRIPPKALLGLHSYCPVHFDAFHVVLVDTSVHISLQKGGVHALKKPSNSHSNEETASEKYAKENQTVRGKCFDKCITKPGTSLSGGESSCISRCVDRYIEATGIISIALFNSQR